MIKSVFSQNVSLFSLTTIFMVIFTFPQWMKLTTSNLVRSLNFPSFITKNAPSAKKAIDDIGKLQTFGIPILFLQWLKPVTCTPNFVRSLIGFAKGLHTIIISVKSGLGSKIEKL